MVTIMELMTNFLDSLKLNKGYNLDYATFIILNKDGGDMDHQKQQVLL